MKKRFLFPLIFFGELIIFIIIAKIFNLETENSILGECYAIVMVGTIISFFKKLINDYQEKHPLVKWLYVPIITMIIASIIILIILLVNLLSR